MCHAGLAAGGEAVERRASEHHRVRAECQRLDHVGAAAKTTVDDERGARADGAHDLRQHLERADAVIQLPAAVVADHDAIAAEADGALGVAHVEDPLHQELAAPGFADPLQILPGDAGIEQLRHDRAAADRAHRLRRQVRLEVAEARQSVREHARAASADGAARRACCAAWACRAHGSCAGPIRGCRTRWHRW